MTCRFELVLRKREGGLTVISRVSLAFDTIATDDRIVSDGSGRGHASRQVAAVCPDVRKTDGSRLF